MRWSILAIFHTSHHVCKTKILERERELQVVLVCLRHYTSIVKYICKWHFGNMRERIRKRERSFMKNMKNKGLPGLITIDISIWWGFLVPSFVLITCVVWIICLFLFFPGWRTASQHEERAGQIPWWHGGSHCQTEESSWGAGEGEEWPQL